MPTPKFKQYLQTFETYLAKQVSETFNDPRDVLQSAIQWSLLNGGKRLRAQLCFAAATLLAPTAPITAVFPVAASIEMIHSYSLIHDDLPAMDNDNLRRGKPACHIQHGEAMAILAGDTLNTYAFQILAAELPRHFTALQTLNSISQLSQASGIHGMAGGQALDLLAENTAATIDVTLIHTLKTGALIESAILIPATLYNPTLDTQKAITSIAKNLGLLYQIIDDILDVEGSTEALGKTPQKDLASDKTTYISQFGLAKSKEMAKSLFTETCATLALFDPKHREPLEQLIKIIYNRTH